MKQTQIIILVGFIVLVTLWGCVDKTQEGTIQQVPVTKNEYRETEKILGYKYGIEESVKKKMLLSEIARHYSMENDYPIDTIAPVIEIEYKETDGSFDVYCVGRTDPWSLNVSELTDIEFLGQYIVTYNLPSEEKLSIQEIKKSGITTDCPFLRVHEASWFVFMSNDLQQYFIVKDVFSLTESISAFHKKLKSQRP